MRLYPGKVWQEVAAFCNCLRNTSGEFKYKTDEQRRQQSGTSNSPRENQNRQGRVLQSAHQIYM